MSAGIVLLASAALVVAQTTSTKHHHLHAPVDVPLQIDRRAGGPKQGWVSLKDFTNVVYEDHDQKSGDYEVQGQGAITGNRPCNRSHIGGRANTVVLEPCNH